MVPMENRGKIRWLVVVAVISTITQSSETFSEYLYISS